MQLALKLANRFSFSSRERGTKYYQQGRAAVALDLPAEFGAVVRGSEAYATTLQWTDGVVAMLCSCPYFLVEGQNCKHLWATILAADRQGFLRDRADAEFTGLDTTTLAEEFSGEEGETNRPHQLFPVRSPRGPLKPPPPKPALWKRQLDRVAQAPVAPSSPGRSAWPRNAEVLYVLEIAKSQSKQALVLSIFSREPSKKGGWKYSPKPSAMSRAGVPLLPTEVDRDILSILTGAGTYNPYGELYYDPYDRGSDAFIVPPLLARTLLPMVLRTERCFLPCERTETERIPLRWDEGKSWNLALEMTGSEAEGWQVSAGFRRNGEKMDVGAPLMVIPGGFLVTDDLVAPLVEDMGFPWIASMREHGTIPVPEKEREEFLGRLLGSHHLPSLDLPESLRYEEVTILPRLRLTVSKPKTRYADDRLHAALTFEYEGLETLAATSSRGVYDPANKRFLRRDSEREQFATERLLDLGLRPGGYGEPGWSLAATKLPRVARALAEDGWHVVAEGRIFRQPGPGSVSVVSGVDWFELHGTVAYGETTAQLPELLSAYKRGETMVTLDDGSYGLIPEDWLRRFAPLAALGDAEGDHLQFKPGQAGLLDALLSAQPEIDCDAQFSHVRRELQRFQAVAAADQPAGFRGQLRDYQREGLGWMHFLRQFSFGGCLADDMGVGKTAQVLALLETRRELRVKADVAAPSLAVVPKSLIFNWKKEVERFTPQLRVLDYTGIARSKGDFSACDLILTTYGTLRRDAAHFREQVFDYIILDEAQAIKNANSASAKAARLLRGNHRLAMSGTPVENHLGELWSLFEFLNPGMLGASGAFQIASKEMRDPGDESRKLLSQALRPFLLRRTKEQVARELPAKVEQTMYCEMEPAQRALYNELRQHYRDSLLGKVAKSGMARSKIQVLEALLRLRQAACHPGLIDHARRNDASAKLDVLMGQLNDVLEEGHKALVFSQFTTLLGLLGERLADAGIAYEYLDGKTQDRQAPVERFQNDPASRLFLISLKAGGVGLNLTAADYVFILDPWWNPAVEAQAVDRAHRIGQTRQVFAYRLIARDTVEEKILQLQQSKRNIADAILGEDNSLIRELAAEDLEMLLS